MEVTLPVDPGDESQVLLVPRHESDYATVGVVAEVGEHMRLPVEVLPFGGRWTLAHLAAMGLDPRVRAGFVTDNGNLIADCALGPVGDLAALASALKALAGVVEHGLFLDEATLVYVGTDDGVERLTRG